MAWLTDLLKEYPALEVARERIALAEARFAAMEAENRTLKEDLAILKGENTALRRQVPSSEFVEARGALFKQKATGQFEPIAYCPECRRALSTIDNYIPPSCSKCRFMAPFRQDEIPKILADL